MSKPKEFVLVRVRHSGKLFALSHKKWRDMQEIGKLYPEYLSEVIAESDSHADLLRFKQLTEEN
jgi:hypothetical protein